MDKSRQRNSQKQLNKSFIIKSEINWCREIFVAFFTILVWIYCLSVIYFFIDALFSLNHQYPLFVRNILNITYIDIKIFLRIGGIIFFAIYLLLSAWNFYNKKRFGGLSRRKYPSLATKEDLMNLNMIDETTYEKLQNEKVIVFEKNPIRHK